MGPIISALIIVGGTAGIAKFMVLPALHAPTQHGEEAHGDAEAEGAEAPEATSSTMKTFLYPLEQNVLVNIAGTSGKKYLSARISLNVYHRNVDTEVLHFKTNITQYTSLLVDRASAELSQASMNELNQPGYQSIVKGALRVQFNALLSPLVDRPDPVKEVLLPQFVTQ